MEQLYCRAPCEDFQTNHLRHQVTKRDGCYDIRFFFIHDFFFRPTPLGFRQVVQHTVVYVASRQIP